MYCKQCGKQIPDNVKFCPHCGTDLRSSLKRIETEDPQIAKADPVSLAGNSRTENPEKTQTPRPSVIRGRSKNKTLPIILITALVAVAAVVYLLFFRVKKLNPEDFVVVTMKGINGYGTAEVYIDYEKLNEMIGTSRMKQGVKKLVSKRPEIEGILNMMGYTVDTALDSGYVLNADNFITCEVLNYVDLSNGDEIIVRFYPSFLGHVLSDNGMDSINEAMGIEIPDQYAYKVKELTDGTPLDLMMPDVEKQISFIGAEGYGKAYYDLTGQYYSINDKYSVRFLNNDETEVMDGGAMVGHIYYTLTPDDQNVEVDALSGGDVLTLKAKADEQLTYYMAKRGFSTKEVTTKLTVGKLGALIDPADIDEEELKDITRKIIVDVRNRNIGNETPVFLGPARMVNRKTSAYDLGFGFENSNEELYIVILDGLSMDPVSKELNYKYVYIDDDHYKDFSPYRNDYDFDDEPLLYLVYEDYCAGMKATATEADLIMVRGDAETDYAQVEIDGEPAYLEKGETVEILHEVVDDNYNVWYEVKFERNGNTYTNWISGKYVEIQE